VGVVITPRFIPSLRVSVDYLDIQLRNAISQLGASGIVANCYDSTDFPNNAFCQRLSRDPTTDQLDFVQTSFFNSSELRYKGILAAVDYRLNTPFLGANSRVGFNLSYQYLDTLTEQADANSAPATLDGTLGYPHHSAVLNVSYENGPVQLYSSINYTGEVDQFGDEAENFRQFPRLSDFVTVNAGITFNVNDQMRFRFIVDNLFEERPPFPVPAAGGVVTYFPGVLGRFYRVGASISF
jgi:iron complex outermembrane receptor protein